MLFGRSRWAALVLGIAVGLATLGAFLAGRELGPAQTMALVTLALAELLLVFTMPSAKIAAWRLPRNDWLLASVAGSALLVAVAAFVAPAQAAFATESLAAPELAIAAGLASLPAIAVELTKALRRRTERRR